MAKNPVWSVFKAFLKLIKWCLYSTIFLVVLVGLLGVGAYFYYSRGLPKLDKISGYHPIVMSEVYDDQNVKIGEFWRDEARILAPIDEIPKALKDAVVAIEDERFYHHSGVDPQGIFRAFVSNLKGNKLQGASTITQQIVKQLVLGPQRTYSRKIKEAILATRIERNLNKDQILYIYLNQVYFGNRAYGVKVAARNYFHKDLKDLNLAEIAMLAGLPRAPSEVNPVTNPQAAKERMHRVLERMVENDFLTQQEADAAKQMPITVFKAKTLDKDFNRQHMPYFVEDVRREYDAKYGLKLYTEGFQIYTTANQKMNQEAQDAVIRGVQGFSRQFGYRGPVGHLKNSQAVENYLKHQHWQTLNDLEMINYYDKTNWPRLKSRPTPIFPAKTYEAVLTQVLNDKLEIKIGNTTGVIEAKDWKWAKRRATGRPQWNPQAGDLIEVKVKLDNKEFKDPKQPLDLPPNHAFILYQTPEVEAALFSYEPFSGAIKTIIGGQRPGIDEFNRATQALLQPGSTIKPLIYAAAVDKGYNQNTIIMDSPLAFEQTPGNWWYPKNYGGKYSGPTTFRQALVRSRNVVTVRIVMDINTHYLTAFLRKLGLSTPIRKYYSMALGSNEVRLKEMARAYGTFVTGGILPQTYTVEKILDREGNVVEEHQRPAIPFLVQYEPLKEDENKNEKQKKQADENVDGVEETEIVENSLPFEPKTFSTIEEMNYNTQLYENGGKSTQKDDLLLTDNELKLLYGEYIPEGYTISPKTAYTMLDILQGVVQGGTGVRAKALGRPAAGKTGTTNDFTDAWFIGSTPNLLTGVWVGFKDTRKSLGRGKTGGNTALPIWLDYMKEATQNYQAKSFRLPKNLNIALFGAPSDPISNVQDPDNIEIPNNADTAASAPSSPMFFVDDLQ